MVFHYRLDPAELLNRRKFSGGISQAKYFTYPIRVYDGSLMVTYFPRSEGVE